ncbi:MAG: CPBP family intramembrane metalloprotease, partial [Myxococcales bacterium]|nr:CPBP family intramembrane metalloprotease [Myxococcales bacterium]
WSGRVGFELWDRGAGELAHRIVLDERFFEGLRQGPGIACGTLASADALGVGGQYGVRVIWEGSAPPAPIAEQPLELRLLARPPVQAADRWPPGLVLLGALLLLLSALLPARGREAPPASPSSPDGASADTPAPARRDLPLPRVLLALGGLGIAFVSIGPLMPAGPLGAMLQGLSLGAVQVLLAFLLIRGLARSPLQALGLEGRIRGGLWILLATPLLAIVLRQLGALLQALIPSTGAAPIETFVSFPSGLLAFAAVALLVPLAEELFFRGLLYGRLEARYGPGAALGLTALLFALVHLPQQWGAWGAFASVALTGLVLTLLRRLTGSTLVPALVHLTHNALITAFAILSA